MCKPRVSKQCKPRAKMHRFLNFVKFYFLPTQITTASRAKISLSTSSVFQNTQCSAGHKVGTQHTPAKDRDLACHL